jgi:hypothetical protein
MLRDIIILFTCNGLFFLERMVIILALKLYYYEMLAKVP